MVDRDSLKADLESEELIENWESLIEGMIDEEQDQEDLLEWINNYRDETIGLIEDVEDADEIYTATVLRYIEAKSHWMILNTHMQYQAVNTGQPDETLMTKGSLMSDFVERLEGHIDEEKIQSITDILSQPIDKLKDGDL